MRRGFPFFLVIIIMLVSMLCAGCKSSQRIIDESIREKLVYVTKDSAVYLHDTTYITNVVKETEYVESKSETLTEEWWDNLTRTWTDSLGRVFTEKYEKGNRKVDNTEQLAYIKQLQDSVQYYRDLSMESRMHMSDVQYNKTDTLYVRENTVKAESKLLRWWHDISFLVGVIIGFILGLCAMKLYKKGSNFFI